jgi:tetratricopeptide (TPR) repeat protein
MSFVRRTALILGTLLLLGSQVIVAQQPDSHTGALPLSAASPRILRLLEDAWKLGLDEVQQEPAIEVLHRAVKMDPDFAFGHELLAAMSLDSTEQIAEQQKAFALRDHASPAERLAIEWQQDSSDHQLMSAIPKMNELLTEYPHDRWVAFLAIRWLMAQGQYPRAVSVYEHSGLDAPGLMNRTAYCYAHMRQFDKAVVLMDRYVAALPHDPNPQDSYAEILRMAGHFEQAVEHYRQALQLDPQFYPSEFGIADTYSLMGDQGRARAEYKIAFQKFASLPEFYVVQWKTREATTFVREGDYAGADRAFQALADYAHSKHMSEVEADTQRQMAIYQMDLKLGLVCLNKAETALNEGKNAMPMARLQQEQARILRTRVEIALRMGNKESASTTLRQLKDLSDRSIDAVIETAYHGAAGADLFSQKKYDQAVSHLEEDPNNPLSLKLLAAGYQKIGYSAGMKRTEETLANFNEATLEQALVVPTFRKCYEDPTCAGRTDASAH